MKKTINIFLIIFSLVLFQNCENDQFEPALDYVTFGAETFSTGVDPGGTQVIEIPVYTAAAVSTDTNFTISVDESTDAADGSYVVPTSVTIPGGTNEGSFTVTLSDVNLGIGINKLVIGFDNVELFGTSNATTIEYIQNCTEVTAVLSFMFDGFASEITYSIEDALGGTVASGGGYSDGQASASENITLCSGRDYTLIISDSFGDGLSFPSNGSYSLTIGGVEKASGGGDFGDSESTAFDTN